MAHIILDYYNHYNNYTNNRGNSPITDPLLIPTPYLSNYKRYQKIIYT